MSLREMSGKQNLSQREANSSPARLGYGTSNLAGRIGFKESKRLLDVAYDAGIRHFDTAPMYGYGAAESLLGEFLNDKGNDITLVTKFGIEPPKKSGMMRIARTLARGTVTMLPSLRRSIAKRAATMVSAGNFSVPYAQMSLRRSLEALKVDHIDTLLMHEIEVDQLSPELTAFLESSIDRGQISRFGIASTSKAVHAILSSSKAFGDVVQMPVAGVKAARAAATREYRYILHSIFSAELNQFHNAVAADPELARKSSKALDFDCRDRKQLGRLFLRSLLLTNPGAVIIFSSLSSDSIARNATVTHKPDFSSEQVSILEGLLRNHFQPFSSECAS